MSLQIWLPLNGDTKNQGLSGLNLTGSPASWRNGKIGKCATFAGSTSNVIYNNTSELNYTDNFSFCLWINHNYTAGSTQFAFTVGRADAGGRGYGLSVVSTVEIRLWFGTKTINLACPANEWHHIALTVNGTSIKVYKDGVLSITTTIANLPTYSDGNGLGLGCFHYSGNLYPYYGSLNDFRIYDHCLSAKEVKEIAKGLVLHYRLAGPGGENIISNSANFSGWSIGSGWTKGTDSETGAIYYKFSRTGATSNNWVRIIPPNKINPNNYPNGITVSMDVYTPDVSAINQKCLMALQIYKADGVRIGWTEPATNLSKVINNKWIRISYSFTQSELMRVCYSDYTTSNVSYTQFSFQLVQNGDIMIKNIKAEEGSVATPWCPNPSDALYHTLGYDNGIEYDCSGFKNNGTKSGTLSWASGSPRYNSCLSFTGNQFINAGAGAKVTDSITVSWWGYMDNWSSYTRAISCTEGGGWNFEPNSGYMYFPMHRNGQYISPSARDTTALSSYSGWHHFVGTYDGYKTCIYVDGNLKGASAETTTKYPIGYNTSNTIFIGAEAGGNATSPAGNYFNGKISDVRIYATALSTDDVKELYNVGASITNNGAVMLAGEVVEE